MYGVRHKGQLCWRHQLALFWAAWGNLLDLTGRKYALAGNEVLWRAHKCSQCSYRKH